MITVKYSITEEDYINYYTYAMWDAPDRKKARIKYYLRQLLINGGIIAILLFTGIFRFQPLYLYAYGGILLLSAAGQIFYARNNIKKQAEKITANQSNRFIFLEIYAEINETGILQKDEVSEIKYQWGAFIKKQENDDYYFLFINSIQAIIFPKRIFKTAEEKMKFEKFLSQYLSFDAEVGYLLEG